VASKTRQLLSTLVNVRVSRGTEREPQIHNRFVHHISNKRSEQKTSPRQCECRQVIRYAQGVRYGVPVARVILLPTREEGLCIDCWPRLWFVVDCLHECRLLIDLASAQTTISGDIVGTKERGCLAPLSGFGPAPFCFKFV
jgi:hypothetical protein